MLAYDWLKQNPVENSTLLNNWKQLFMREDIPYAVKKQLIAIEKDEIATDDTSIYWHSVMTLENLTQPNFFFESYLLVKMLREHPLIAKSLHTAIQLHPDREQRTRELFFIICRYGNGAWLFLDRLQYKHWLALSQYNFTRIQGIYTKLLQIMRGQKPDYFACAYTVELFNYMSLDFVDSASVTWNTLNKCIDILRDVSQSRIPPGGFRSLNALQLAHDKQAQETVKQQLSKKPDVFVYHPDFIQAVESCGFYLPPTSNALIERGVVHNNCVGSYVERHKTNTLDPLSRIILGKDFTIELSIYRRHNMVVSVDVDQCKGKHNKIVTMSENVSKLQVAITGLPSQAVNVGVRSKYEQEQED
jgi:hypothetical protein